MSSITQLNTLGKALLRGGGEGDEATVSITSNSTAHISRNTLSKILSDIKSPTKSWSCGSDSCKSNSNSDDNASSANAVDVDAFENLAIKIEGKTKQTAMRIVNVVRYLSSPLRLILKMTANFKGSQEERMQYVSSIKICDEVKCDVVGAWNDADTFGLRFLVKVAGFKTKLNGVVSNQETYMQCFQPKANADPIVTAIAFYLYRVVMGNPLPVVVDMWQKRMNEFKNDENTADYADFSQDDLKRKVAWELNNYAVVVLQKRMRLTVDNQTFVYHPQQLLDQLYQTFNTSADLGAQSMAQQMQKWLSDDSDVPQMGGRKKRAPAGAGAAAKKRASAAAKKNKNKK